MNMHTKAVNVFTLLLDSLGMFIRSTLAVPQHEIVQTPSCCKIDCMYTSDFFSHISLPCIRRYVGETHVPSSASCCQWSCVSAVHQPTFSRFHQFVLFVVITVQVTESKNFQGMDNRWDGLSIILLYMLYLRSAYAGHGLFRMIIPIWSWLNECGLGLQSPGLPGFTGVVSWRACNSLESRHG